MPAALQYYNDPNIDEAYEVEKAFGEEIAARAERFQKNWNAYDGNMPDPLKVEQGAPNDNVKLPKVGQVADKAVSFLLGDGVEFDSEGDGEEGETDEQIKALWQQNRGDMLMHNIALTGAITGHVYVRLEPHDEQPYPRIVNLNPRNCAAFWQMDDVDRVLWYRLQYQQGERGSGKRIDYVNGAYRNGEWDHDVRDAWYEVVYATQGGYAPVWKRQSEPRLLPYAWSPIVDWQNLPKPHAYYGADDVTSAVALNAALNFIASNYARILKHHAAPVTVGLGFDAGDIIETSVGGLYTVNKPPSEANMYNLEMQSDLVSSKAFMDMLATEMWSAARMIDPATVRDRLGQLTNFGLRVLYLDTLRKTETKRLLYAEGLESLNKHALEMAGQAVPDYIEVVWPNVLPEDLDARADRMLAEVAAGLLDKQTYSDELGRDWEQIMERLGTQGGNAADIGSFIVESFNRGVA